MSTQCTTTRTVEDIDPRYAELRDRRLVAALSTEDHVEAEDGLDPLERTTCWTHRRWLHQCIASPLHVIQVTGHRWCRTPDTRATRQIMRACRASFAAATEASWNIH